MAGCQRRSFADMIEEPGQPLRELRRALHGLASVGSEQRVLFPDQRDTATQLARDFDQSVSAVRSSDDGRLSVPQLEALAALERKLTTMSKDGAEFDADLWTDAAVRTSEHWAEVRRLAAATLDEFSGGHE